MEKNPRSVQAQAGRDKLGLRKNAATIYIAGCFKLFCAITFLSWKGKLFG